MNFICAVWGHKFIRAESDPHRKWYHHSAFCLRCGKYPEGADKGQEREGSEA